MAGAQEWLDQVNAYLAVLNPKLRGLKRLHLLEQNEPAENPELATSSVAFLIQEFEKVKTAAEEAADKLQKLIDVHYPALPALSVTAPTLQDLTIDRIEIDDALLQFTPDLAVSGEITIDTTPLPSALKFK